MAENPVKKQRLSVRLNSVNQLLAMSFILIALLPIAIIGVSLYKAAWDDAWREIHEKHRLLAINLASPISIHIHDHQQMLALLADRIRHYQLDYRTDNEKLHRLLKDSLNSFSGFQSLFLVGAGGNLHAYATDIAQPQNPGHNLADIGCLQPSLAQGNVVLTGITTSHLSAEPVLYMCRSVLDETGEMHSIAVAELSIAPIEKLRASIYFGERGHSAIVDQNGKVIAHPNPVWMKQMRDLSDWEIIKAMLAGNSGVTEFYSPFVGESMVAGYAAVPSTGWGIMVPQPKSEVEKQVNALLYSHLQWGTFGLALAIMVAMMLARWITSPINRLATSSMQLVQKDFDGGIPDSPNYAPQEVKQLTSAIQTLTEGFKASKAEIHELNQSLQDRVEEATKQLRQSNLHLELMATLDDLTGLPNRRGLHEILEREHARAKRNQRPFSILLCDLDRFKLINDNYGHGIGDQVLMKLAKLAPDALRDGDCVGRWGGEEFLCVLADTGAEEAGQTAERLRQRVATTMVLPENLNLQTSVSIGVATYPRDGDSVDTLLSCADAALYEAKRAGRNRIRENSDKSRGVFSIAGQLQEALNNGTLRPAYQKIVDLKSGEVVAEETLARIVTNDNDILDAHSFIEAASQLQLVHRIDYELISQTIRRSFPADSQGGNIARFVNISTDLLRHPDLIARLTELLKEYCRDQVCSITGCMPLVIEITEREFLGQTDEALRLLTPFLDMGITLALDDFGSGYSSFRYLADLPVTYLKIEGDLVRRGISEPRVESVLHAIQDSARSLNVITLAECVENQQTLDLLREVGVDWAQGHYFGSPQIV
jgi:diguanylate cyclase (GGDEF)-like protein